jgi:hypothetical protein
MLRDVEDHLRQIEICGRFDLERDHAQNDVEAASLARDVHAKTTLARQFECEIVFVEVQILRRLGVVFEEQLDDFLGVLGREDFVPEFHQITVESIQGQLAHPDVDI